MSGAAADPLPAGGGAVWRYVVQRPSPAAVELLATLSRLAAEERARLLRGEPHQARTIVGAAAEAGLPAAQVLLGRMLLDGAGGERDEVCACGWFQRAAAGGDVEAWNMVGRCFENGWGVSIGYAQAAACYRHAARAGDSWAQYNLGHLYLDGQGVRRDPVRAFQWYWESARQGHARAMNLVGRCYEQGWGVSRDRERAASWYRASAERGYFRGQYNHASLLMVLGRQAEALVWLRRAAAQAPPGSRELIVRTCAERWEIRLTT